jgi:hypothetical protein
MPARCPLAVCTQLFDAMGNFGHSPLRGSALAHRRGAAHGKWRAIGAQKKGGAFLAALRNIHEAFQAFLPQEPHEYCVVILVNSPA